ncbi:hypothetical protein BASA81_008969 [Batrachochytrium salamandrivorans]|nr:hypothetical protein BASA81_008969 [Batrachochytrium salamandrivorans]
MFVPALTLILALASSAVIAVPTVNNVYKRSADSLDPSSTDFPFYFPESFYESIPHSGAPPSPSSEEDDAKTATDYIFKKLNLGTDDFKNGVFKTKFNSQEDPGTAANIAAAAVNLFYITNTMHDITYQHGFTESAGNFQKDNFGLGGKGNDAVTINVLNPSKFNNAGFITPADGQPGVMNMYRYTVTTPNRSPGFDNTIIIHEYTHGISSRLTGGPATACASKQPRQEA